jgi:hypothetical protein
VIAAISAEVEKMMLSSIATGEEPSFMDMIAAFTKFREYSVELRKRRSAILTDAQIAKVRTLQRLPRSLSLFNLLPQWVPGPGSWRPGDPIPVQQQQPTPRLRPFPRSD